MLFVCTVASFLKEIAVEYCLFLPLDLWAKHAIKHHTSEPERRHIWLSEAQILAVVTLALFLWRLAVPWLLVSLTVATYLSGRGSSPGHALSQGTSAVCWIWLESTSRLGAAVDGGIRKVFPQHWKFEQATTVVLGTVRWAMLTTLNGALSAVLLCRQALVHWYRELWEAYHHHADTLSTPMEARASSSAPPRLARRATFSGVVDRLEVADRSPPDR